MNLHSGLEATRDRESKIVKRLLGGGNLSFQKHPSSAQFLSLSSYFLSPPPIVLSHPINHSTDIFPTILSSHSLLRQFSIGLNPNCCRARTGEARNLGLVKRTGILQKTKVPTINLSFDYVCVERCILLILAHNNEKS